MITESIGMIDVRVHSGRALSGQLARLEAFVVSQAPMPLSKHPRWLLVLKSGLGHTPYCVEATEGATTRGVLPLAHVHGPLFGRFLVSLPYVNYGGVLAEDDGVARLLIDRAARLAEELEVRYLELRHEGPMEHRLLTESLTSKVHMRLPLAETPDQLWNRLPAKVRNL